MGLRILLVYCNSMLENAMPIGLTQVSACLKQAGHQVGLFDTTFYRWGAKSDTENRIEALQIMPCPVEFVEGDLHQGLRDKIIAFAPDLVGFSVVEPTFDMGMGLVRSIQDLRADMGFKIAAGGVHAVIAPETFEAYADAIDFLSISEGEETFPELCRKLEANLPCHDQTGYWVSDGSTWIKNERAPLVDLDSLPFLDFTLFPPEYMNKPMMGRVMRTVVIETTRGCPYHCSYCCDHTLKKMFADQGHWYRKKSITRLREELDHYVKVYDPEFIYVMSESFLAGAYESVRPMLELFAEYKIPFWFNTRPEDITPEKIALAKEANLMRVSIGVESGDEAFRKEFLHRNHSNDVIKRACSVLNEFGISFSVNIIIGFPHETREQVFKSIALCRELDAAAVSTHIFNPYHGTEMRDISVRSGFIADDMIASDFFQEYALTGNTLSSDEVRGLFRTIPLYSRFPENRYEDIRRAETFDEDGEAAWEHLKVEYYDLMGWNRR